MNPRRIDVTSPSFKGKKNFKHLQKGLLKVQKRYDRFEVGKLQGVTINFGETWGKHMKSLLEITQASRKVEKIVQEINQSGKDSKN